MAKTKKQKNKKQKGEKRVADITKDSGFFAARLSKTAMIHDVAFDLRPLPNIVQTYITGKVVGLDGKLDLATRKINYIRFGVTEVRDTKGEKIEKIFAIEKVMDRSYNALTLDFIDDSLPPDVLDILFVLIHSITHMSKKEIEKLDFTFPLAKKK